MQYSSLMIEKSVKDLLAKTKEKMNKKNEGTYTYSSIICKALIDFNNKEGF